jgi:hypothetical protein
MGTEFNQFPEFPQGEAQPLHLPDEANSLDTVLCIQPESTRTTICHGQQVAFLIEADSVNSEGGALGDLSDLHARAPCMVVRPHDKIIQSGAKSRVQRGQIKKAGVEQS